MQDGRRNTTRTSKRGSSEGFKGDPETERSIALEEEEEKHEEEEETS